MARILIIDDEPEWLELTRKALEDLGHLIVAESDSLEAFRIADRYPYDLVILDVKMPLNGRSHLWFLSASKPDLPVIIHSAHASMRKDEDFRRATAFVVKSLDFRDLQEAVNRVLPEVRLPARREPRVAGVSDSDDIGGE